jgi:hypothetical protein
VIIIDCICAFPHHNPSLGDPGHFLIPTDFNINAGTLPVL